MENNIESLKVTILAEDSVMYESPFWGQHGISFLLETQGSENKKIMIDVGQNFEALFHNMQILEVDPCSIDALVLTHCHYDHTEGVSSLLEARGNKELPIIAHPDLFRPHFITSPFLRHVGMSRQDSREKLESKGGRLLLTSEPLEIMPGIITTGEIPRVTDFEDAGIALKTIKEGKILQDEVHDDISVLANVKNKGIVVLTGCSHAGIVNISFHAMKLIPGETIEAVIGGFHLIEASGEKIDKTVKALYDINPGWVASGHCTGFRAQARLFEIFEDRFSPLSSGRTFEI